MKRFLFSLLALVGLGAPGMAQQVPNGNLETWTTAATADRPQSWLTTDDLIRASIGLPIATNTTTKTTDKYSGTFAAKVQTLNVAPFGLMPGYLILGTRVNAHDGGFGGLPYTGRPAGMQLRYKLTGTNVAVDSAYAGVLLTRTVNGQSQTVGEGVVVLTAASSYTLATIPLQYYSSQAPDSIRIIICSGIGGGMQAGTAVYVDDITLTNALAASSSAAAASHLTAFPNPSADGRFTLEAREAPALLRAALTVTDVTGRVVLAQPEAAAGTTSREVDLHGQPAGIYAVRLATAAGPVVRRLVVN